MTYEEVTMDYEQKYKEALDKAKEIYNCKDKPDRALVIAEKLPLIFPELKEIEDEKIPKKLHRLLCAEITKGQFEKYGLTVDLALNWLEKQNTRNSFNIIEDDSNNNRTKS